MSIYGILKYIQSQLHCPQKMISNKVIFAEMCDSLCYFKLGIVWLFKIDVNLWFYSKLADPFSHITKTLCLS